MKVCVLGSAGHIGSALLVSPLFEKHQITVLDNMSANHHAVLFRQNLTRRIEFIEGDILDYDLDILFKGKDIVINLAAITDAAHSHLKREQVEAVNFKGAVRVAEACARNGARMFFPSSTSVYGKSDGIVDETCTEIFPQSPYAESKIAAERAFANIPNLKYVVCRFGTIYGPSLGLRYDTFCNMASWRAATRQPITVWETALNQYRPYLFIGDAVNAISHIIDNDLFNGQTYNVLTENATVQDIVNVIKRHRPDAQIELTSSPLMNQLQYRTDCSKFKATGWVATGNINDGLAQEMDWLSGIN